MYQPRPRACRSTGLARLAFSLLSGVALVISFAAIASAHLTTRSSSIRINVGESGSNAPHGCGEQGTAVSGGFENPDFDRQTSKLLLWGFNPVHRASWRTTAANLGEAASGGGTLTVFAYCDLRAPRLVEKFSTVKIKPRHKASATADCPKGSEAVSGGFSDSEANLGGARLFGFRSKRVRKRGWRASAFNMSSAVTGTLIAVVDCDRDPPELRSRVREVTVPSEGAASVSVRCGERRETRSGGFAGSVDPASGDGTFPFELMRRTARTWSAAAFDEGEAAQFTVYTYCGR
jgi:hypothetical protein